MHKLPFQRDRSAAFGSGKRGRLLNRDSQRMAMVAGAMWLFAVAPDTRAQQAPKLGEGCRASAEVTQETTGFFEQARAAYDADDKAQALTWLTQAHEISNCAEFLFMIAELSRELQKSCAARDAYQRYLAAAPQGENVEEAREWLSQVAASCEPPSEPPASPPATAAAPSPALRTAPPRPELHRRQQPAVLSPRAYWTPLRIAGWSSVGAAVLAGAGALYFVTVEQSAATDLESLWKARTTAGAMENERWAADSHSIESEGRHAEVAARILGVGSAVLAISGGVLLFLARQPAKSDDSSTPPLRVHVGPGAARATYSLQF